MKSLLGCFALATLASCTTLENRRDLYSVDPYFWQGRDPQLSAPHQTTTSSTTTTTISNSAPRREEIEPAALPQ